MLSAARNAVQTSGRPLLLAVSGGIDSMALMAAMTVVARDRIAAVATFDHGTGAAARRAVREVRGLATGSGLNVVTARTETVARPREGREAAWREARHRFLRESAARLGAQIVTAHTRDDQIETVLLRIMRGSGARGLAGLYAESAILRPFLDVRHAALEAYLAATGTSWVSDPSNSSDDFARNRVRLDLLPTLCRVDSHFGDELLGIARRADDLRRDIEAFVTRVLRPETVANERLIVASGELTDYDRDSLAVLWAALAGRVGLALDRRGTRRIAEFTSTQPRSGRIPLAGGWCLRAGPDAYILERSVATSVVPAARLPDAGVMDWGRFRFRVSTSRVSSSPWTALLSAGVGSTVRAWSAGDRLEPAAGQPRRRVTRYLSDVGMKGTERLGWPVVVAGDDVVWIPGVRRSDAATDRSGRPVRHYVCERIDR